MSEENTGSQPQQSTDNNSFLGTSTVLEATEEHSNPSVATEAEEGAEGSVSDTGEAVEKPGDEQVAETPALPRIIEELNLAPEELADYQRRYPSFFAPNVAEDLVFALRDKINGDREIKSRLAESDEPTVEEPEQEGATAVSQNPQEDYQKFVSQVVDSYVDPKATAELGKQILEAVGWDLKAADDPKRTPEEREAVRQMAAKAPELGNTLARGAVDIINTVLPNLLAPMLNRAFPEFGKMYERSLYGLQWEQIQNSKDASGQPMYANLPVFGTEKFQNDMRAAAAKVAGSVEDFDAMVFRGKDGRPLPVAQQAQKKYAMLAKVMSGQAVNPAVAREAVETGKKIAAQTANRRAAGKALGAGSSKGQLTTEGADPLKAAIAAHRREADHPFGGG